MDKQESLRKKKAKRRKKRTKGKEPYRDFPEFVITQKGKDALIKLGMKEEDFYAI